MRNLLVSLVGGAAVWGALFAPGLLKMGEAILPAIIAVIATYFVLARRTFKQVEKLLVGGSQFVQQMPPRFDLAIAGMEKAYAFSSAQFGVKSQIDNQIGVLYFLQKEFSKALPYLEKSLGMGHWMGGAMLGVIYYKKKNHDKMRETFKVVTKKGKKQSLPWALYAYLLCQIGERDQAQAVLVEGLGKNSDDPRLKDALLSVQNGKKIRMRTYKEQWYQFHLERPPVKYQQSAMGTKVSKQQRRGRW